MSHFRRNYLEISQCYSAFNPRRSLLPPFTAGVLSNHQSIVVYGSNGQNLACVSEIDPNAQSVLNFDFPCSVGYFGAIRCRNPNTFARLVSEQFETCAATGWGEGETRRSVNRLAVCVFFVRMNPTLAQIADVLLLLIHRKALNLR